MTTNRTLPIRLAAVGTAAVAALTLSACGSDDDTNDTSGAVAATSSSGSSADASEATSASPATASDGNDALLAAAKTVLDKVSGSRLTSIETDPGGWEVQVATDDGTEYEAVVAKDGSSISTGPTKQNDDAQDKKEHLARLDAAKVDYQDAVTAIEKAASGSITELNLDDDRGATVWEADVRPDANTKVSVRIDAASGEVLGTTTESPDDDD